VMPRGNPAGYLPNVVAKRRASRTSSGASGAARSSVARRNVATKFSGVSPGVRRGKPTAPRASARARTRANARARFKR